MHVKFTAEIVQAYVANNEIPPSEIPNLILSVHQTLSNLADDPDMDGAKVQMILAEGNVRKKKVQVPASEESSHPVVPISEAVSHDGIICLICGKSLKAIKGHLSRTHGMDLNAYRRRFSLDKDFPMVAPSYSDKRRRLAKETRLGERAGGRPGTGD